MVEMLATFLDHDYIEDADQIIQFLESNGMLPPSYQLKVSTKGIGGAVAAKRVDGKWEPEDEEK